MATIVEGHHHVLLTGASGFIGNHIISELLVSGCSVRAIVRSQSKISVLQRTHSTAGTNLDFAVVPDMTSPGAFSAAFESTVPITAAIHTASPFLYKDVHKNSDLLDPAIQGTQELLRAAAKASSVRKVVITGSIAAVIDYNPGTSDKVARTYTNSDWNPVSWDEAIATGDKATVYRASKTFAEKAAWDFMRVYNPKFALVVLLPPMVYGPPLQQISNVSDLNESNLRIWTSFLNSTRDAPIPPNGVHYFIDVRDLAVAHLKALISSAIENKRLIIAHESITSQQIADILRCNLPQLKMRTPMGMPGGNPLPNGAYEIDGSDTRDILHLKFHETKNTFVDLAHYLLSI